MTKRIKVMIVDDSALVRQMLSQILAQDPAIEVIGTASDPIYAMEKMRSLWPDVLILDLEMPRMDGISFLRKIMAEHPTPTIICSSHAEKGAKATIEALALGAITVIAKPKSGLKGFLEGSSHEINQAVRTAARVNLRALPGQNTHTHTPPPSPRPSSSLRSSTSSQRPRFSADVMFPTEGGSVPLAKTTAQIIAIGTSTGGTQALEFVLTRLPADTLGIVVVQHMPERFTGMFAQRLDNLCQIAVHEAKNGDKVTPGKALIAPGGKHMMIKRNGTQYTVEVVDGPMVNRHKPSVDVLFRSVARMAGPNALGIIMTGMGDDGAQGLKEMRDTGARTVAQDEASCVVFGMPKEAIKRGAAEQVVPLTQIPGTIMAYGR